MTTDTKNIQARVPLELHTWTKMQALREGTTVNELVERLIVQYKQKVDMGGIITTHTDGIFTVDENSSYPEPQGEWGDQK